MTGLTGVSGPAMRPAARRLKNILRFGYRFMGPFFNIREIPRLPIKFIRYFRDLFRYGMLPSAERIVPLSLYPCVHDNTGSTPFDPHYFYQDTWAFREVVRLAPSRHVDVGSTAIFVGMLSAVIDVTFVDIRPLSVGLDRYTFKAGSILEMPFDSNSVESLSCLHVAEHIGLGRYGDPLDAEGTRKAARELTRVLAPGGQLLFSVPIGRSRIEFNAHRIHSSVEILEMFRGLSLVNYAGVDDLGSFRKRREIGELDACDYGCGFFTFIKPATNGQQP